MATVRLVASTYSVSNNAVTVSDPSNMYTNTDSDTYATATHTSASTSSYYVYLKGFNFGAIPTGAEVTSFTVKLKARETGVSTSSNYRPRLVNNTTTITGSSSTIGTTASVITFTNVTATWATISGYGANFGIRINTRRSNSNTQSYAYIYGAEIEVTYAEQRTVTSTLTGSGTIDPSGAVTVKDGETYTLTITPTNASDTVTATKDGTDITSSLVYHNGGDVEESNVLGAYTLISGGFNGQGASYFQGLVGKGHTATQTTASYYSSSQSNNAVFQYNVAFTDVPSGATIKSLYMIANGHPESTSQSSEYMCVQLKSGSTTFTEKYNFKSSGTTSNTTHTINATTLPTISQLQSLVVECTLGYYGGAINGVTVYLTYEVSGVWYTYTMTVSGNATIAVVIGGGGQTETMYIKVNGSWVTVSAVYKKVNGAWVVQSNLSTLFSTTTKYVKGA